MKLTIITVVKNNFTGIYFTILSVLKQNFKNYEYIIIDGNSKDFTNKVVLSLISNNKNIKYFKINDKNLYHAINKAINISTGDFVGVLSSGDIYYDNLILKKINKYLLEKPDTDVLSGNLIFYNNKNVTRFWRFPLLSNKINLLDTLKIPHSATFIKKKILLKYLYDYNSYRISADTDFFLKIFKNKKINFKYLDKTFIFMKDGGLSTSLSEFPNKFIEDIRILFKYFNLLFLFIYFFKITIKIPSFFFQKKKYYNYLLNRLFYFKKL